VTRLVFYRGEYQGVKIVDDKKVYGPFWDSIIIPATEEQERSAEQFTSHLVGQPFDWKCMIQFVIPWNSCRDPKYCSAIILEVLQHGLHMFPGVNLKISPNGLYRIFLSCHSTLVYSSTRLNTVQVMSWHRYRASARRPRFPPRNRRSSDGSAKRGETLKVPTRHGPQLAGQPPRFPIGTIWSGSASSVISPCKDK
jgi:hypothetical protein